MTRTTALGWLHAGRPRAIAHRGGALEAEENTWPAFENAVRLGFTHIELDVHTTTDGHVVIHHDPTLERMAGDPRRLDSLTWAQARQIRTHGGAELPLLADLLERWPQVQVNIDPKSDAVVDPLAQLIHRMGVSARIGIGSFKPARTNRLRSALGATRGGGISWSPAHAGVAALWGRAHGLPLPLPRGHSAFPVVQVPRAFRGIPVITRPFLRTARRHDIHVQVWTIDDPQTMNHLLDLGVDGIMTDRPSVLKHVLEDRGEWHA